MNIPCLVPNGTQEKSAKVKRAKKVRPRVPRLIVELKERTQRLLHGQLITIAVRNVAVAAKVSDGVGDPIGLGHVCQRQIEEKIDRKPLVADPFHVRGAVNADELDAFHANGVEHEATLLDHGRNDQSEAPDSFAAAHV